MRLKEYYANAIGENQSISRNAFAIATAAMWIFLFQQELSLI